MNRTQAITLLEDLIDSKLIEPTWVSLESKTRDIKLKIKGAREGQSLRIFCSTNNLKLEEENDYLLIST